VARLRAAAATPAATSGGAAAAAASVSTDQDSLDADREDGRSGASKVECLSVGPIYGTGILPCDRLFRQTAADLQGQIVKTTTRDGKVFAGKLDAVNLDDSALPEHQRNKIVLTLPQAQQGEKSFRLYLSMEKTRSLDNVDIANTPLSKSAWKKVGAVGNGHADKDKDKKEDEDGHKSSSSSIENDATNGRFDSSDSSGSGNSDLGGSKPSPVLVSPSSSSSVNSSSSSASSSGMKRVRGGSKAALEAKKKAKVARTASNSFDLSDSDDDLVARTTSSAVDLCDTSDGEEKEEDDGEMVML
jgi:hypothetical protein